MKVFVCALAILYVAVLVSCEDHLKHLQECKEETGITDEIKQDQKPDFSNPKVQEYYGCVLKKDGTLKDGKINKTKFLELLKKYIDDLERLKNTVATCSEKANSATVKNDGERAAKYKECLYESAENAKHDNPVE
uniref:Odorant binding protein 2 n=1 Tax=Oobius agrili TaxID=2023209 RepID=A0A386AT31_9HYME|nr:odorant binding protein 2 [Oobius agrili]